MKKELDFQIPNYKIFDFHRHVSNLEEFDRNLNRFNISKFCLMPSMIEKDFNAISKYIEKVQPYVKKYRENALIFGLIDFSKDSNQNIDLLTEQKQKLNIKGIKIHPEQGFEINKISLELYFKAISEVLGDVPIYIHMDWPLIEENGYAPRGKKSTFNKIVTFFPDHNFIMGHAGGSGDYLKIWRTCKKYPNVYIETSMAPTTSTLSEVVWKVGADRILFGSNYPYCGSSIEVIKIFSMYKVSEDDKRAIFESNWEGLLKV